MTADLDLARQRAASAMQAWGKVYAQLVAKQGNRRGADARRLEQRERDLFAEAQRLRQIVKELEDK